MASHWPGSAGLAGFLNITVTNALARMSRHLHPIESLDSRVETSVDDALPYRRNNWPVERTTPPRREAQGLDSLLFQSDSCPLSQLGFIGFRYKATAEALPKSQPACFSPLRKVVVLYQKSTPANTSKAIEPMAWYNSEGLKIWRAKYSEPWVPGPPNHEPPNHDPPGAPGFRIGSASTSQSERNPARPCQARAEGALPHQALRIKVRRTPVTRSPLPEELKFRPTSPSLGTLNLSIVKRGCGHVTKKEAKAKNKGELK
ncbi:uncharacterized protein CLUP02_14662 [Colletotrichum lupini]|uniref:Uncharacterized protein n=1 Tax=Colletotrichum lupini TaxID=145971 RepID=A0A9Q8T4L7_9PEZI|nr:uncharacterized protein CLUP02_14662 [Colletotrichum lupini]UQC89134.1 hypothetical protein CLUP02_14662 [Colletotrichum lupini]